MALLRYEFIFHWAAVVLYVLSTIFFAYAVFFQKEQKLDWGIRLAMLGLVPHSVALGLRWYVSGHGPYLSQHEGFSSIVWVVVIMFLIFAYRIPKLKWLGLIMMPSSFLMMAVAFYKKPGIERLPPTFHSIWLVLHITFTKFALGAILIALGTSIFYILKEKKGESGFYKRLPALDVLDTYSYKFAGFGFVFWTITVIAGAIWANESWGRYWGWDPIETWSLITWLLFGLYLHLRRFSGWRGSKAAYLMIICFLFSLLTLFVVPFVMTTIHSEFFV